MRTDESADGRNAAIGRLAFAALCALAMDAATAETWASVSSRGSTTIEFDVDSVSPVAGWPGAIGAWVRYTHALSVDCSPPRGCYAASQRIYYHAVCPVYAIAEIRRISMDLNGNIVSQTAVNANAMPYFPPVGSLESLTVRGLCEDYQLRFLRPSPPIAPWPAPWPAPETNR